MNTAASSSDSEDKSGPSSPRNGPTSNRYDPENWNPEEWKRRERRSDRIYSVLFVAAALVVVSAMCDPSNRSTSPPPSREVRVSEWDLRREDLQRCQADYAYDPNGLRECMLNDEFNRPMTQSDGW